jgi:hypothetical protein
MRNHLGPISFLDKIGDGAGKIALWDLIADGGLSPHNRFAPRNRVEALRLTSFGECYPLF